MSLGRSFGLMPANRGDRVERAVPLRPASDLPRLPDHARRLSWWRTRRCGTCVAAGRGRPRAAGARRLRGATLARDDDTALSAASAGASSRTVLRIHVSCDASLRLALDASQDPQPVALPALGPRIDPVARGGRRPVGARAPRPGTRLRIAFISARRASTMRPGDAAGASRIRRRRRGCADRARRSIAATRGAPDGIAEGRAGFAVRHRHRGDGRSSVHPRRPAGWLVIERADRRAREAPVTSGR